jgi:predicted Zn-dependent protease
MFVNYIKRLYRVASPPPPLRGGCNDIDLTFLLKRNKSRCSVMVARSLLLLSSLISAGWSCAPVALPPIDSSKSFQVGADEKKLWDQSEIFRQRLEKAGLAYEDPELEQYLNSVAARLLGGRLQGTNLAPKVKVVKDPFLSAFTFADGSIYFHTGLLARMENEAQLATIMGHELAHFLHRDSMRELRHKESRRASARVLQGVLILTALGMFADTASDAWVKTAVEGYSKEIEAEADKAGIRAMVESGYDPGEVLPAFTVLKTDWNEAKVKEPYFYGSIALLQERIDNNSQLVSGEYQRQVNEPGRRVNAEEYTARIHRLLLDNAVLDLEVGRLRLAESSIAKHLATDPQSPQGHFLMGEFYRRSGNNEEAVKAYARAVAFDAQYADAHRELGLMYRAMARPADARAEFEKYLVLRPKAVDAPIIERYVAEPGPQ